MTRCQTEVYQNAVKRTWGGVWPKSSRNGLLSARGCSAGSPYTIWFKTYMKPLMVENRRFYKLSSPNQKTELKGSGWPVCEREQRSSKVHLCLTTSMQSYASCIIHHLQPDFYISEKRMVQHAQSYFNQNMQSIFSYYYVAKKGWAIRCMLRLAQLRTVILPGHLEIQWPQLGQWQLRSEMMAFRLMQQVAWDPVVFLYTCASTKA